MSASRVWRRARLHALVAKSALRLTVTTGTYRARADRTSLEDRAPLFGGTASSASSPVPCATLQKVWHVYRLRQRTTSRLWI